MKQRLTVKKEDWEAFTNEHWDECWASGESWEGRSINSDGVLVGEDGKWLWTLKSTLKTYKPKLPDNVNRAVLVRREYLQHFKTHILATLNLAPSAMADFILLIEDLKCDYNNEWVLYVKNNGALYSKLEYAHDKHYGYTTYKIENEGETTMTIEDMKKYILTHKDEVQEILDHGEDRFIFLMDGKVVQYDHELHEFNMDFEYGSLLDVKGSQYSEYQSQFTQDEINASDFLSNLSYFKNIVSEDELAKKEYINF